MIQGIDYIGVCVTYFCHDGRGGLLMAKRTKNARDEHGRWCIGAGAIEFGESVEGALRREIREEYGTDVREFEFLGYRDDTVRSDGGRPKHWVSLDFKVLIDSAKVSNPEPHKFEEVRWFTKETIPSEEKIHSLLPDFFRRYRNALWG